MSKGYEANGTNCVAGWNRFTETVLWLYPFTSGTGVHTVDAVKYNAFCLLW